MIRRLTGVLLLATTVAAQALPGAAGAMVCGMERGVKAASEPAQSEDCTRCSVKSVVVSAAALTAGSCCRFGPPSEIAAPSAAFVSGQRTVCQEDGQVACLPGTAHARHSLAPRSAASHGPVRSTSPPPNSTTTLRL